MRQSTSALQTLLRSKVALGRADLFTITLQDGSALYWTSADGDIVFNGHTFSAKGPLIERSRWQLTNTMQATQLEVNIHAANDASFNVEGQNIKVFASQKGFDGASLRLERIFWAASGPWADTSNGTASVVLFSGRIGAVTVDGTTLQMKVNGSPILFNQNFPKNVYQPTCLHTVYDSGCGLNPASFTFSSTADVTSDAVLINFTGHVPPTSVANLQNGLCTFTSGALAGLRRTIRYVNTTDNNFAVAKPFPQAPAAGDAFTVTWGCQRSKDYCNNVMNNLTNFRGTPYVPIAEVSY